MYFKNYNQLQPNLLNFFQYLVRSPLKGILNQLSNHYIQDKHFSNLGNVKAQLEQNLPQKNVCWSGRVSPISLLQLQSLKVFILMSVTFTIILINFKIDGFHDCLKKNATQLNNTKFGVSLP